MTCSQIQDILITDYLDGEIKGEARALVDEHLARCPACREFSAEVIRDVSRPFQALEQKTPPEEIWMNIQSKMETPALGVCGTVSRFRELIGQRWVWPKPVWALTAVCLLMVAFALSRPGSTPGPRTAAENPAEPMELMLAALGDESADDDEDTEFDTAIEEYFL